MDEKILTPDQVAQILQVHPFTVLKFIKQGKLRASKLGRVYRIRESDVMRFLDEGEAAAASKSNKTTPKEADSQTTQPKNQMALPDENVVTAQKEKGSKTALKKEEAKTDSLKPQSEDLMEAEESLPEPSKESFVQSVSKKQEQQQTPNQTRTDEMDHYILD